MGFNKTGTGGRTHAVTQGRRRGAKTVFTWSKTKTTVVPRKAVRWVDETEGDKFRKQSEGWLRDWIYTGSDKQQEAGVYAGDWGRKHAPVRFQ